MYQVTYIVGGRLQALNTPCKATATILRFTLPTAAKPRLWHFVTKGQPQLIR